MELKTARATFAKYAAPYANQRSSDNNAFGALFTEDEDYIQIGRWACHGFLNSWSLPDRKPRGKNVRLKYVLSAVMKPHNTLSVDDVKLFVDWMVNRSPWAYLHVDKSAESVLKLGYLVDANNNPEMITSGFIGSRFISESHDTQTLSNRCEIWKELLRLGCSENEAFFFSQMYASESKNLYPIIPSRFCSGHSVFFGAGYQENYVRNFLQGTPENVDKTRKMRDWIGYTHGVNAVWASKVMGEAFFSRVQKLSPPRVNKGEDYHIFRKERQNQMEYANSADFLSVIEQLRGLINAQ